MFQLTPHVHRNATLGKSGIKMPKTMKTGTTIVGLVYNVGDVLCHCD